MRKALKTITGSLLMGLFVWVFVYMLVDAKEFETTGACEDCIVLQHLRPGINQVGR